MEVIKMNWFHKNVFWKKSGVCGAFLAIIVLIGLSTGPNVPAAISEKAQEGGAEEEQVFKLGEIIVSAEREEKENPTTISEVTAEDIERHGASNLGEALNLVPGVYFHQGRAKNEFYATVRGFEQEKVLILLDGVPIYVPYEGLVNLIDIPVQNIARIKVIKGVSSPLYGPNNMGGVINIITKKGGPKPSTSLSYQGSDYKTHHLQLSHGWKKGDFSYFIGGSHRESDGFNLAKTFRLPQDVIDSMASSPANPTSLPNTPIAPDKGRRDNSDYDRNALTFTGNWDLQTDHALGLSFEYYKNEYGVPPVAVYREHKKGFFYFPRYWRFNDWERYTTNVIEESRISESWRIKFRLFYDAYENTLDTYDDDTYTTQNRVGPPSGKSLFDDYNTGFNLYAFWSGLSRQDVRLGLSFKRDVHREKFNASPTDELASHTYSIGLEDKIQITPDLSSTLGASYDTFDKQKRHQADSPQGEVGDDISSFNPQIGVNYEFSPSVNLYASVGRKICFPTMRNLYATGVVGPEGNPDLKGEKSDNYELGGAWSFSEKISLDGALFYSDIKDLINFDNQIGRFEQYERANISGFEFGLSSQLASHLHGRVGYTFMETKNHSTVTITNETHDPLVYKPDELPYRPEHKVDFDLSQTSDFGMKIDLNGSFISGQTYYDHADISNNKVLVAYKEQLDSFFLLNVKVSQEVTQNAQIYLAVDNLLNEDYQELFLVPGQGITVWAGIKISM